MTLKKLSKNFYINLFLISLIFTIDRITKKYVIYLSDKEPLSSLFSSKFLNINLIWNEGVAFGLFSFDQNHFYNLLTMIIVIIILILLIIMVKSEGIKKYSLLMIFGGALGNLYDRFFYKAVPDFIDFHIEEFHWFIFNVADIFISIGVILMILFELIVTKRNIHE